MISRFVFVWLIAGGLIYALAYLLTKSERKSVMRSSGRIFSGRSDEVRDKTVAWIVKHTSFQASELDTILVMRRADDHRPDDELKQGYIDKMLDIDRRRLVAVFDDRDRVVKTWRTNGITCLQVAEGNF